MVETENKAIVKDEIDLIEVFTKIWDNRRFILKITSIFFIFGLIVAFGTQKEYKAESTLFIESGSGSSVNGLLQQFGGLAGLNIDGNKNGNFLDPELYPQIIQSSPFLVEIMAEKIHYSKSDSLITIYKFLKTEVRPSVLSILISYTIGLPGKIIGIFSKGNVPDYSLPDLSKTPLEITSSQEGIMSALIGRIQLKAEESKGTLLISTEMPDPIAAAELTNIVYKYLSKYLIEYKIQKVKTDLDFITVQYNDAKQRYLNIQQRLAAYSDANRNIMLASYQTEEERLKNEYLLAFNIYNGLSQQMEQAKLKVQEKTPALKIMDPVKIPLKKSKPMRSLILMAFTFLGALIGTIIILIKFFLVNRIYNKQYVKQ